MQLSHPMWVRGLKLLLVSTILKIRSSHPMWVRGLKHSAVSKGRKFPHVAPHVGAWIETPSA